jgi:Zn-dependent protease/CBS domain-containing protein
VESSIKLLTVSGIEIRMHLTFPLILLWGALQFGLVLGLGLPGAAFGVLVTLLLFVIVVLHELGHSYAALGYKIPVQRIVLLPIGGVAELGRLPEDPRQELVVALAGPAVNFVLAVVLWLVAQATPLGRALAGDPLPQLFTGGMLADPVAAVFQYVFSANLAIGLFNLLPAFPLDGGRVLRALLAMRLTYPRATAVAVGIGQTMAWLLGLWGVLNGNFFLVILAIFIYMAGSQEGRMVQVKNVLASVRVRQAFARRAVVLMPYDPVSRAVELTLQSFQADFPVCDGGRVVGLVTAADVMQALQQHREHVPVAQVMRTEFPIASPLDSVYDVQQRMLEANLSAVPVVEDGVFVGMLTSRDISELYQMLSVSPHLLGQRSGEALPR